MSDLSEIKSLIEAQGRAWEEFKATNDALVKSKAEGKAVSDLEEKLVKIGKEIDMISELKGHVEELQKKLGRPDFGGEGDKDLGLEVKGFNDMRSARAPGSQELTTGDYKAYKSAFWKLVRKGNIDMLNGDERKALSAGSDPDGGYLLPTATVGRIAKKVFDLSPVRQIANVMNISADALEGINDTDEVASGWVGEAGTRSDSTTPQVGKYRIEAHEMYSQPKATQKLLDDAAVDIEAWLAMKVADKFARTEGAAFCVGTGVGQPKGVTAYPTAATADATRAWGTFEHVMSGASADFAASNPADKLFDLLGAFKTAYLQNAKWLTLRSVITKIRKFKEATTNAYMWQPGLQAGQPDKLLGYPIVIAQDMPALAADSLSLAFGDFNEAYTVVDRVGVRTLRDPYTDKPYVKFYSTKRCGGGAVNFEAVKFIKFNT